MKKILLFTLFYLASLNLALSQCTGNTSQYPAGQVTVDAIGNLTTISTCNYLEEYTVITGIMSGDDYEFTVTSSGYITVEQGGAVLIHGVSPLTATPTAASDITVYWNADASCATATDCETTTVQCTSCTPPPPPANDAACMAQPITVNDPPTTWTTTTSTGETNEPEGTCWFGTGTQESVWFTFVAPASGKATVSTDFDTALDDTHIAVYSGSSCSDFADFAEVGCSEDEGISGIFGYNSTVDITTLIPNQTYYVQVDGYLGSDGEFMLEVKEISLNSDCADATLIADSGTTGSGAISGANFSGATDSGMGAEGCENTNASMAQMDLWYEITTDGAGDLIVSVQPGSGSDVVIALYNSCGDASPVYCADLGMNGSAETINAQAFFTSGDLESSTRADQFFLRVYEKTASGEPFDVTVQGSALPIELAAFNATAERRANRVQWSTVSEINSDYVEVQSSPNGSTRWESVGMVQTKGESLSRIDYDLVDANPYAVTYYRLKAVDKDGKSEISHAINVKRDDKIGKMSLSPNPTNSNISLQTVSNSDMIGTVVIHDMTGKVVQNQSVNLINGLNTLSINLDDLNAGIYLFSLRTEDGVQVEKIVKQ